MQSNCTIPNCPNSVHYKNRGWCKAHWLRWWRNGDPLAGRKTPRPKTVSPEEWVWRFIDKTPACWLWTGYLDTGGYGRYSIGKGVEVMAHRFMYEMLVGPIPDGYEIDHLCRVRHCENPEHMEPVTHRVNDLRGVGVAAICAKRTHCPQGHPYDEANTKYNRKGHRECRTCRETIWRPADYLRRYGRVAVPRKRASQK